MQHTNVRADYTRHSMQSSHEKPFIFHFYWFVLGNAVLFCVAIAILANIFKYVLIDGILFWTTVISLIVVRYVDIRFFKGQTSNYEPATMAHWRKYSLKLLMWSLIIWIIVATAKGFIWTMLTPLISPH
jgi:uncharacterized membrane-anchored protein